MTRLHVLAASLAMACITIFSTSTVIAEVFLSHAAVVALKTHLPWGFLVLVPAMAVAGITGNKLANGRSGGLIGAKLNRMKMIAANGALVLIPSAFALAWMAGDANFGAGFYLVQTLELLAGATNLTLMGLNMRDGRKMTAGRRRKASAQQ